MRVSCTLLLALIMLGGCAGAVVGGGAAGGYYGAGDERSAAERATDGELIAAVKTRLYRDPDLRDTDIRVDSLRGVVTLSGSVPDARFEQRAVQLTRDIPGVTRVVSRLVLY